MDSDFAAPSPTGQKAGHPLPAWRGILNQRVHERGAMMEMIFGDECELEYRLGLIREEDQSVLIQEPMLTAHYIADRLRAGLMADGVEAHQIADTSDIVSWFLVYEAPQGSWHRAYAQCLATLMIYFFDPAGPLDSPAERLSREADLMRLETECGYVLMADRLRQATEEVSQKLEKTWLWFERTNDSLIDVSRQLDSAKKAASAGAVTGEGIAGKFDQIIAGMGLQSAVIQNISDGVTKLQPKETDKHRAARLAAELEKEKAEYAQRGQKFTVVDFRKRWAVKEGCGPENIKRLLTVARKDGGQAVGSSPVDLSSLAAYAKAGNTSTRSARKAS